jgi:hypothetical protein
MIWLVFVLIRFKVSNIKCKSHVQEIIMQKNFLIDLKNPFWYLLHFNF